uniref:Uncharacterized protein n=1 Tax=Clastoptera arizonana TaxID=38151 RepID=A0A1B6DM34_9HEMI
MCRCAVSSLFWLLTLLASTTGALDKPDISWGDWIIIDDTGTGDSGASLLLRRITPKSVFVAPNFNSCPEGYSQDSLGRCVKIVQINKQAQWNFFLDKIKAMYSPQPSKVGKESGPFHINLPIGGGVAAPAKQTTQATTTQQDTSTPSTVEEVLSTIDMDRETSTISQETSKTEEIRSTTKLEQEAIEEEATKSTMKVEDTTRVEEVTKNNDYVDESTIKTDETTKLDTEITKSFTDLEKETTTEKVEDADSKAKDFENQTENITEIFLKSEEVEFEENAGQEESEIKRPFIIVVTGKPDVESVTESDASVSDTPVPSETVTLQPVDVKPPQSVKSKCDLSVEVMKIDDGLRSSINCEPPNASPESVPTPADPIDPESQVRFPSQSNLPVRKASTYIRFPSETKSWDSRIPFRWPPSWDYRRSPDIVAWPPVEKPSSNYHHYTPQSSIHHTQSWSNSPPWRRIVQRN